MILHDAGLLAVGNSHKLHTTGSRPLSRCSAALPPLPSPRAQRPLVGRRAGRHRARVAGPLWHLAPPLSPRLPRGSQTGGLARVCAHLHREQSGCLPREARALDRPLVKVPPAGPGARKQPVLNPSAAPEAGGPPRGLGVPRTIARRSSARARPGPPPPPRRAANCCLAGARPPLLPRC